MRTHLLFFCLLPLALLARPKVVMKQPLSYSLAEFRAMVYPPVIPRAFDVSRNGCPVCGTGIMKHGSYAWIIDPAKPFKLQCPECKNIFPSNDFVAYWKSGFKNKSLLKGKYVDDGRGYAKPGVRGNYWFVAYYNHWFTRDLVIEEIPKMAERYAAKKDPAYARRVLVVLDRIADFYPDFDYNKQSRYAAEVVPSYTGRMQNAIWETGVITSLADAYWKVRPFLDRPDAELAAATGKNNAAMKANIETRLFRTAANDIMSENGRNSGNFGMHQVALIAVARLFGNDPAMLRWITDYRPSNNTNFTPLDYALHCNFYGDGTPMESPGYNRLWMNNVATICEALQNNGVKYAERHPFIARILRAHAQLVLCGRFFPASGDSGNLYERGFALGSHETISFALRHLPSAAAANIFLLQYNVHPGFFIAQEKKELLPKAQPYADPAFGYRSGLLSAYGIGNLQNGDLKRPAAVTLSWGAYVGHKHCDGLHFELFNEFTPLLPDLGYPESASGDDPRRFGFFDHTISHNTVLVDASRQKSAPGLLLAYQPETQVKFIAAEAPAVYDGLSRYRRSLLFYCPAPGRAIVLDCFRVKGGKQHDYILHGTGKGATASIPLAAQKGGTLAGPKVANGVFYDAPELAKSRSFGSYSGSGFQFLWNVRRGRLAGGAAVLIPSSPKSIANPKTTGVFVKVHLTGKGELILCDGEPQRTQSSLPRPLPFLVHRRAGAPGLESHFATVFESGSDQAKGPAITKVRLLADRPEQTLVRLDFDNGEVHYLFDNLRPDAPALEADGFHFTGGAGALLLKAGGAVRYACVRDGGAIARQGKAIIEARHAFTAKITALDLIGETITLDRPLPDAFAQSGRLFTVLPGVRGGWNGAYRVGKVSTDRRTVTLLDQNAIRGRFRFPAFSSKRRAGLPIPALPIVQNGMTLFAADAKTPLGRVKRLAKGLLSVDGKAAIPSNQDLWIGEIAPGDTFRIPDFAETGKL